jgi:hypothetical protein
MEKQIQSGNYLTLTTQAQTYIHVIRWPLKTAKDENTPQANNKWVFKLIWMDTSFKKLVTLYDILKAKSDLLNVHIHWYLLYLTHNYQPPQ